jgi:hypothetical protein
MIVHIFGLDVSHDIMYDFVHTRISPTINAYLSEGTASPAHCGYGQRSEDRQDLHQRQTGPNLDLNPIRNLNSYVSQPMLT